MPAAAALDAQWGSMARRALIVCAVCADGRAHCCGRVPIARGLPVKDLPPAQPQGLRVQQMSAPNAVDIGWWGLLLLLLRLAVLLLLLLLVRGTGARAGCVPALYKSRPHGCRHENLRLCCSRYHRNECSKSFWL